MSLSTVKNLQSHGLATLSECIFEDKTLHSLSAWCKEIFNASIDSKDDFIFKNNCLFLPTQASYSMLRLNRKRFPSYADTLQRLDCIAIKRFHDEQRGVFVDLLGLGEYEEKLYSELTRSELYHYLSKIYNAHLLNIEFHVYSTRDCVNPRGWHLDGSTLKLFTYLTDVTINDGPYAYQLGSHRHYSASFKEIKYNGIEATREHKLQVCQDFFNEKNTLTCSGNFGTSFISDQSGIHRGLPQSKGRERHVLVVQFNT